MTDIRIRDFIKQDSADLAGIKLQAFGSKFRTIFKWDETILEEMILFFTGKLKQSKIIVAENQSGIVGYMLLNSVKYPLNKTRGLYKESVSKFGFLNTVKYYLAARSIESVNPGKDECYINQIAVSEKGRGMGVGSLLLEAGERECRSHSNISRNTLYVMKENVRAHKLYESRGFVDKKELKIPFMKALSGYSAAIFMEKKIG